MLRDLQHDCITAAVVCHSRKPIYFSTPGLTELRQDPCQAWSSMQAAPHAGFALDLDTLTFEAHMELEAGTAPSAAREAASWASGPVAAASRRLQSLLPKLQPQVGVWVTIMVRVRVRGWGLTPPKDVPPEHQLRSSGRGALVHLKC